MSAILILYAWTILLEPFAFHRRQPSVKNQHRGNFDNHIQEEKKMAEFQILSPIKAISEAHIF